MFENVINFFKKIGKKDQIEAKSKDTAKERLHLVLMQDRANVSADFLDMMRQRKIPEVGKHEFKHMRILRRKKSQHRCGKENR